MHRHRALASLLVPLALGACAPDQDADTLPALNHGITLNKDANASDCSHPEVEAAMEAWMVDYGLHVCNIALADHSGVVYTKSLHLKAFADPDEVTVDLLPDADIEAHTPMPIGSFSKSVTAIAFLELFHEGHIVDDADNVVTSLDTEVGDILHMPSHFPAYVGEATLHELLTHTSGMSERVVQPDDGDSSTRESWGYRNKGGTDSTLEGDELITENWTWLEVLDTDDKAVDHPGAHPRIVYRAMLPPDLADYDKAVGMPFDNNNDGQTDGYYDGAYSNMNYLLLGAVIDEMVTRDDFDGYPDSGPWGPGASGELVPGYESWTWWVLSGQGTAYSRGALDLTLGHPWRQDAGGMPGDPPETSYFSKSGTLYTAATEWGFTGYESPDGGWVMPVADMARIALMFAQQPSQVGSADMWDDADGYYVQNLRGLGKYGYGTQIFAADGSHKGQIGHGGTIKGFMAAGYAFPTNGDYAVAISCNTQPKNGNGSYAVIHDDISLDLYETWMAEGDPVCTSPGVLDGSTILAQTGSAWFPSWSASVEKSVARSGAARTLSAWISDLDKTTAGTRARRHLEAGDLEAAAECALVWAGDRTDRWTCR